MNPIRTPINFLMRLLVFLILTSYVVPIFAQEKVAASRSSLAYSLTKDLDNFRGMSLIPGFAVSIVNEKGVRYLKGFGVADKAKDVEFTPLTINDVASVSKTFVAVAIMKLVEQGQLKLDAPVNSLLPYKITNPHYPDSAITVRHLVTHTSSIIDSFEPYSVGEADVVLENEKDPTKVPAYIQPNVEWHKMSRKITLDENIRKYTQPGGKWYSKDTFLRKEPGTHFQYSNLAASIAARIVERRSGMSFIDFTKKYLFAPLGMKDTAWNLADLDPTRLSMLYVQNDDKKPTGVAEYPRYFMTNYPVSGLKTNATDLGKFLIEMIRGSHGAGIILNKQTYKSLFEPQRNARYLPKLDPKSIPPGEDISVLWSISKDGAYYHLGGNIGVSAFVHFNPKTKTGSLAFCNLRDDSFAGVQTLVYRYENQFTGIK